MNKHYTLSSRGGIVSLPATRAAFIGQTAGCDVRVPDCEPYAPAVLARVEAASEGGEWRLVRLSPHASIAVNGRKLNRVHYLADGDTIEADNYLIRFNIREGELAHSTVTPPGDRRLQTFVVLLIALVIAAGTWMWLSADRSQLSEDELATAMASLVKIEVDSLCLMEVDSIIDTYVYPSRPVGTAFLTSDSLLVTARHCVQPWLNAVNPMAVREVPFLADRPVAMALRAETANQFEGSERLSLVSHLTLTAHNGSRSTATSRDFRIDTSRDEIIELGDYDNDFWWRSVARRYGRADMMLGDVAVMAADNAGSIVLADSLFIATELRPRTTLTFLGFPMSEGEGEVAEAERDELRQPLAHTDGGELFMLAHGGALSPGYSGGPVLVKDGAVVRAVGVVSVLDLRNGHRSYSVPVTTLKNLKTDEDSQR